MKKIFYYQTYFNKPKRKVINKSISSRLLILSIVMTALFTTPITALANSNARDGGSSGPVSTNVVSTSPNGSSKPATNPWISLHMLDKTHGWALTSTSVLKTMDGG